MTEKSQQLERRGVVGAALLGVLIVIIVGGLIAAQAWKQDLRVSQVRVEGNRIVPTSTILGLAAVPRGARLFDVDLLQIYQRVRRNPFVQEVVVQRNLPNGIDIQIAEREPVAVLSAGQLFYVDADGVVLPLINANVVFDLPVLTGAIPARECIPGKPLTRPAVREALRLLRVSRELSEQLPRRISEVNIRDDGDLIAYTAEFGIPVIFGQGDLALKLAKLDAFWNDIVSNRGTLELASLDVRFEDRVIARWAAENKTGED
jgi:cell division protein FtsQ